MLALAWRAPGAAALGVARRVAPVGARAAAAVSAAGRRRASLEAAPVATDAAAAAAALAGGGVVRSAAGGGVPAVAPERPPIELPIALDEIVIVDDAESARAVAAKLMAATDRYHAVDTEVDGIDLSKEGPVGNGLVTCFTAYSGPDFAYADTPGQALFVDTTAPGVLDAFADWFAATTANKVWHCVESQPIQDTFNVSVPERIFGGSLSRRREPGERIRTVQESWETSSI